MQAKVQYTHTFVERLSNENILGGFFFPPECDELLESSIFIEQGNGHRTRGLLILSIFGGYRNSEPFYEQDAQTLVKRLEQGRYMRLFTGLHHIV